MSPYDGHHLCIENIHTAMLSILLCAVSFGAGCMSDESGASLLPSGGQVDTNQAFGAEPDVAVVSTALDMTVARQAPGAPIGGMGSMTIGSETEPPLSDMGLGEGDARVREPDLSVGTNDMAVALPDSVIVDLYGGADEADSVRPIIFMAVPEIDDAPVVVDMAQDMDIVPIDMAVPSLIRS